MNTLFNNIKTKQDENDLIELEGQIERLTYTNEETGYTVAKVKVSGYLEPITAVGNLVAPTPGAVLMIKGSWLEHPKFGRQFKISSHRMKVPSSVEGIKKYLGSGLIAGIGPVMASRIVERFGEETLEVIELRTKELEKVEGIGRKRVQMIKRAWDEQADIREVMIFLQGHGVSSGYATKIFKRYGHNSISVLTENPYTLATDVYGIGFQMADRIAEKLGFEKTAPVRAEAGILYLLGQFSEEGHVYYPYELLIEKCTEILEVDREIVVEAFGRIAFEKKVLTEDINSDFEEFQANQKSVYLPQFHRAETGIAHFLSSLFSSLKAIRRIEADKAIEWVQGQIRLELAPKQIEAVKRAISDKVMVITGGPGTGKTTIINAVIKIYRAVGAKILLAAPTGRASKRMSEATGYPAKTIHRMLGYSFQKGGFQKNQARPLEVDVLILDEVSMVDTILMYHLLKAVPPEATVIMVGDVYQLPSVGAGSVLKDIIRSQGVPVVELKEIFRQAEESLIIVNAHKINNGQIPELKSGKESLEDFYFIEQDDPEQVLKTIMELVCERIPRRFNLDPVDGIQVLSPMHKGVVGTESLNRSLQDALNPSKVRMVKGDRTFRLNDKVMQMRNNYEKEVFNGDIGRITSIDPENRKVTITFEDIPIPYDFFELDEVALAYAISVHKSQGSEYPAVVIPILSQHYILLQRNLIYTAVTRGKRLVIMVGSKRALAMGIRNDRIMRRYTYLCERLKILGSHLNY
jgi:exodeoxyribonuclease V alpha subunit